MDCQSAYYVDVVESNFPPSGKADDLPNMRCLQLTTDGDIRTVSPSIPQIGALDTEGECIGRL